MNEISELETVQRITMPHMAEFYGHAASEGVSFTTADDFHNAGIDGSGVTLAIIDGGFFPTNSEIVGNVISSALFDAFNFCNGDIACGDPVGDSHGTAVAEIVVDEAPGVSLRLYTIATDVDYNNAVNDAIANGVDIITASLGFPTLGSDGVGPNAQYFRAGTSNVAKKMNDAFNNGIYGTISAGNAGDSHWMGTYVPSATVSLSGYQSVMEFQPNANGVQKVCLPFTNNGWRVIAAWDDAINNNNNYDLFVYKSNLKKVLSASTKIQPPQTSTEIAPGSFPFGNACIVIASKSSTENHHFHIYVTNNVLDPSFRVRSGSIGTPADSSVMAVGAIRAANPSSSTSIDDLEPFSSSGPTDDGRAKPEICGPDGTLSHQSGLNPFFGTSSSAPHTAGAAALFLQQDPSLTPSQLKTIMENSARFNSNYSVDNLCGANSGALLVADIVPPQTTILSATDGNEVILNDGDFTDSDSIEFEFSASDNFSTSNFSFKCNIDSGGYLPCSSPHSPDPLGDGEHTMEIQATDEAGNTESTATFSWTVDSRIFCNGLTITQLIAGGTYNLIDNRGGPSLTLLGTGANDLILAGDNGDVVKGGQGDDCIIGGEGIDNLTGSKDNDTMFGNGGNDLMFGATGVDELNGGAGDDLLRGNADNDLLNGDEGNDILYGGPGANEIRGGIGDDDLKGADGIDTMYGEDGNDTLFGAKGDDVMLGGDGDDLLKGGPGNNEMRGGAGDDVLKGNVGIDTIYGDEGNDRLEGGNGDDFLDGGADNDEILGGKGNNELRGGAGDDVLKGNLGIDTIYGEDGNDTLFGSQGDDVMFGGDGNDLLKGGAGNNEMRGGAGDDVLKGNINNDTMFGDAGNDVLTGSLGDDTLDGGPGADELIGGQGFDTCISDVDDLIVICEA